MTPNKERVAAAAAAAKKKRSKGAAAGARSAVELYAAIMQTLEFCLRGLLVDATAADGEGVSGQVVRLLGDSLYPSLCTAVIEQFLAGVIPLHESQLQAHKQVADGTVAFERQLRDMRLAPEDASTLSDYVSNVDLHHSNKLREELLCKARDIMLASRFNTVRVRHDTERGGLFPQDAGSDAALEDAEELAESIYRLPACAISQATQSVVELAYTTLSEMASPVVTPKTAVQMFYGVRDIFDLFRALMPVCHGADLATVPQVAVVFHNDCFYIAHHLLSMGHQFRDSLPDDMVKASTFIDMVPAFRELGERHFLTMMQRQETGLMESIAGAGGVTETQDDKRYAAVERKLLGCRSADEESCSGNCTLFFCSSIRRLTPVLPAPVPRPPSLPPQAPSSSACTSWRC